MRNDCMENINNASVNAELIEEQAKIREINNKADKKALFSFVVLIIASMLVGGVGGFYAVKLKMHGALDFQEMIFQGLAVSMPYVLGVAILMAIFGGFFGDGGEMEEMEVIWNEKMRKKEVKTCGSG